MPSLTRAEKEEKKRLLKEKREKREARRHAKKTTEKSEKNGTNRKPQQAAHAGDDHGSMNTKLEDSRSNAGSLTLDQIPEDSLTSILCFLPARDVGACIITCKAINSTLREARVQHLLTRLDGFGSFDDASVKELLEKSQENAPANRLVTKRMKKSDGVASDDYPAYARFIEETVCGYAVQNYGCKGRKQKLPKCVNGRIASVSPEHSLCRTGGSERAGAGGSGCAAWGIGKRGQLGNGKREDVSKPAPIVGGIGTKIRIVQVSAGGGLVRVAHSLLLTDMGQVLSFGTAMYGQLGHGYSSGKTLSDEIRPRYIEALRQYRITCISAGELHSACVTEDGDVYTWGDGFCGQLGHGDKRPKLLPEQVTKGELDDECVESVVCGHRHTICVTEDGECFTFGLGHFGVLGRSYTPFEYTVDIDGVEVEGIAPAPPAVPDVAVDQAPLNGDAAVLLENPAAGPILGNAISAEMRQHLDLLANLTLDDRSDQCIPVRIDSLEGLKIVGASAGHRHSIVLDEDGGVYTFGCGKNGKLGHGDLLRQEYPLKIMEFANTDTKIIQISAGVDASMAVSSNGDVYSWGKSSGGRIGHPSSAGDVLLPRVVPIDVKAVDVECGYVHSLIVGIDGSIHVCGGVGLNGEDDGQQGEETWNDGSPGKLLQFNVWHRTPEPKEFVKKTKWKKYGTYELKGRSKAMAEKEPSLR